MPLEYITDRTGAMKSVVIPIEEWEQLKATHQDLGQLESINEDKPKIRLSELAGRLSQKTADEMLAYVSQGRANWEETVI